MQQESMEPVDVRPESTPEERFGEAVQAFRSSLNWSQRDLAAKLADRGMSVDASAVSRIEKGQRSVRLVEAMAIAEVFKVDLDFLISEARTPSQELDKIRHEADLKIHQAVEPMVNVVHGSYLVADHLRRHPELLETLVDQDGNSPESAQGYIDWVIRRFHNWAPHIQFDDSAAREGAVRMLTAMAEALIGKNRERTNGLDQETS